MRYEAIILDTETTHVESPEVIELAWRSFSLAPHEPQLASHRFKPKGPISLGALATHHILESELAQEAEWAHEAARRVPEAEYWIGHNVDFDWRALGSPPSKRICTLAMSRSIWPTLDSHSLSAMIYFISGRTPATRDLLRGAHGAMVDTALCATILSYIIEQEEIKTLGDLYRFSEDCRIPRIMTFGKFKSQPVTKVDKGWANWYARQEDTDPYLIAALRRAGKL